QLQSPPRLIHLYYSGCVVCSRRGSRGSSRTRVGLRRPGLGNFLGHAPVAARERSAFSGSAVPIGGSLGIRSVRRPRHCRRPCVRYLHQASSSNAGEISSFAEKNALGPTRYWRLAGWSDGLVRAATLGRGVRPCWSTLERRDPPRPEGLTASPQPSD